MVLHAVSNAILNLFLGSGAGAVGVKIKCLICGCGCGCGYVSLCGCGRGCECGVKFCVMVRLRVRVRSITRFPTVAETPIFDDFCFLAVSAAVFLIFSGLLAWCLG